MQACNTSTTNNFYFFLLILLILLILRTLIMKTPTISSPNERTVIYSRATYVKGNFLNEIIWLDIWGLITKNSYVISAPLVEKEFEHSDSSRNIWKCMKVKFSNAISVTNSFNIMQDYDCIWHHTAPSWTTNAKYVRRHSKYGNIWKLIWRCILTIRNMPVNSVTPHSILRQGEEHTKKVSIKLYEQIYITKISNIDSWKICCK